HYPAGYFSFQDYHALARSRLWKWTESYRVKRAFGRSGGGSLLGRLFRPPTYMEWVRQAGITRNDTVLDIGCGSGKLLVRFALGGFADCTGVDPFIAGDIVYNAQVRVLKRELADFAAQTQQRYGLIMLHHAFEHMRDPHAVLRSVCGLLRPGGCLLIRIPLADGYAWETYREDWVQLDAPRHLYLHTQKSMRYLADLHGFTLERVLYDSGATQILGSELYRHDIPLTAGKEQKKSVLTPAARRAAERQAEELNRAGRGDQAAFFLRGPGTAR
ncbi:MAG TPA: class I SAM-dependent methyltransferase, partial [Gammaproteobacteria bacterium]